LLPTQRNSGPRRRNKTRKLEKKKMLELRRDSRRERPKVSQKRKRKYPMARP